MDQKNKKEVIIKKTKEYFHKIVDKEGFYIILFICICIVATTAVWISKNNLDKVRALTDESQSDLTEYDLSEEDEDYLFDFEDVGNMDTPDNTVVDIDNQVQPEDTEEEKAQPEEEQKTNTVDASSTTDGTNEVEVESIAQTQSKQQLLSTMMLPLNGNISMDYAYDKLVYSKTLEQWTTHIGVDIVAREGTVVRAALEGIVSQIKKDTGLGIIITLDHGNGVQTKYGNLSTAEMVTIGQRIEKGNPISGVGKGAGFEMSQGPHLHYEVLIDGENVNPKDYLPKFQ